MSWNYRVVKFAEPGDESYLVVQEVHYDSTGGLQTFSNPQLSGSSFNELQAELRKIEAALRLPALDSRHFSGGAG